MINIISSLLISAVVSLGVYNYVPVSWMDKLSPKKFTAGTTVTTINGNDTLSNSRTTINTNFSNLNTGKIEVGSTTINALTSAPNLATIGTVTGGTWNGTAIGVAYGGTGTTTPTSNQVILGNGSSGFKVIGFGSSGQFLTSGGNGVAPSWSTSALDPSLDYNWTGIGRFKNLHASSTVANPIVLNTVSYAFPSSQGASSTVLQNNASGVLTWLPVSRLVATSSALSYTSSNATTTRFSTTLPGGSLGTDNIIVIKDYFGDVSQSTGNGFMYEIQYGSQNKTFFLSNSGADSSLCASGDGPATGQVEIYLRGNGNTSSQSLILRVYCDGTYSTNFIPTYKFSTTMTVDSTSDQTLTLNIRTKGNGVNDRYNSDGIYAQLIAR